MQHLLHSVVITLLLVFSGCSQSSSTYQIPNGAVKEGFVKIKNGQLYYQIVGKGDPIIVIHGGPGFDQGYLLPGMALLAKNHQVIFYDQCGSGLSTVSVIDEQHINDEQFVEDLETLRKALGYPKITLVGHSTGGMLAMRYAIKYGSNVKKMVLMNTLPATTAGIHDFVEEVEQKIAPSAAAIETLRKSQAFLDNDQQTIAKFYSLFFQYYFHNPADLEKLNMQLEPQGITTGMQVARILENSILTKFVDLTHDLKKLKIPTLIIHGESDVIPLHTAEEIAASIKNSRLVVLKQCGHFPYIEKPQEWLEVVEEFLRKN
jgi:proline iminopeptidase